MHREQRRGQIAGPEPHEELNLDLSRTPQGSQEPDRILLRVALLPLGGSPPCEFAQACTASGGLSLT